MIEYEGPHISYPYDEFGLAVFERRCPHCRRFVRADKSMPVIVDRKGEPKPRKVNASCSRCGRVAMTFEGWF